MKYRNVVRHCYQYVCDYNLFVREENEYADDNDTRPQEAAINIHQQKFTTWLYVFLLVGKHPWSQGLVRYELVRAF